MMDVNPSTGEERQRAVTRLISTKPETIAAALEAIK
jgi:hypothetical protein